MDEPHCSKGENVPTSKARRILNGAPLTSFQQAADFDEETNKQVMTKDEIEELRKSVIKTVRPRNPWFDGTQNRQQPSSNGKTSGFTASKSDSSMVNKEKENVKNQWTSAHKSVTHSKPSTAFIKKEAFNGAQQHSPSKTNKDINPNCAGVPITRNRCTTDDPDIFRSIASDIKTLEQLETEHIQRINSRILHNIYDQEPVQPAAQTQVWQDTHGNNGENRPKRSLISSPTSTTASTSSSNNEIVNKEVCQSPPPSKASSYEESEYVVYNCSNCGQPVYDMILKVMGKHFHASCFRCAACRQCLDGIPFAMDGSGTVFCMEDYGRMFLRDCVVCNKPISAINEFGQIVRIVFQDNEYHIECFCCEGCNIRLSNEPKNRCYPMLDHLLCQKCHIEWRKNGGPITDL